jgi:hypothetical protein
MRTYPRYRYDIAPAARTRAPPEYARRQNGSPQFICALLTLLLSLSSPTPLQPSSTSAVALRKPTRAAEMGSLDTSASLSQPPAALQLDTQPLAAYLSRALPDEFVSRQGAAQLEAHQFSHGQVRARYSPRATFPCKAPFWTPSAALPVEKRWHQADEVSRMTKP